MKPLLTRESLARVLQSLITSTYRAQGRNSSNAVVRKGTWKDNFSVVGSGSDALGCDSLDLLQISAAVNEMFHLYEAGMEGELLRNKTFGQWLDVIQQSWQRGVKHLTVTTSGSTGLPKRCTHPFSNLFLEIDFLSGLFLARSRIVAFTPAHHLYGLLFTAMLPDRIACPVHDFLNVPDSASQEQTRLQPGDLVVSFPQGWEWINRSVPTMAADVEGVVSTAPCPTELVESLVPGKLIAFTEVYGSSETSGIGTRRWPAKTYSLMPQWSWERSADLAPQQLRHLSGFDIEPMDHLDLSPDGTFLVCGRRDCGVQVGGVNVFPQRIAERLRSHPDVAEASVRLMRPQEGDRLMCFVVPREGCTVATLRTLLDQWIESWPIVAERPRTIKVGLALPPEHSARTAIGHDFALG